MIEKPTLKQPAKKKAILNHQSSVKVGNFQRKATAKPVYDKIFPIENMLFLHTNL